MGHIILFYVSQVNQEIEVRPGIVSKDSEGKLQCRAIFSRIVSLFAEQNDLQYAVPGGLIGRNSILCDSSQKRIFVVKLRKFKFDHVIIPELMIHF